MNESNRIALNLSRYWLELVNDDLTGQDGQGFSSRGHAIVSIVALDALELE